MLICRGQPDFHIVSFRAGGKGEVFVVANALKSFILKLDMVTSIFFNILSKIVAVSRRQKGRATDCCSLS